jgi:hypothetical protein
MLHPNPEMREEPAAPFPTPSSIPPLPPEVEPAETRLGDLPGAAFRLSNDVNALLGFVFDPSYPPDPTFNGFERAKKSPLYLNYGIELAQSQSEMEFLMKEWKIRRELEDRQILAGQGWAGFGAAMLAQLVSPTSLIPIVGQAKGVKGVAQAFGLAAAVSTGQEAVLYASQETATEGEALAGIAAGTVIGGLLGSAAVYLRPGVMQRVAKDLEAEGENAPSAAVHFDSEGRHVVTAAEDVALNIPGGDQRFDEFEQSFFMVHGGSDFDEVDYSKLGTGEPGNIRPLGNGLYGYMFDPDDMLGARKAISYARNYAEKYGKGEKALHIFQVAAKGVDYTSNGPLSELAQQFGLALSAERKAVSELYELAGNLPVGEERSAAFDAAKAAFEKLPKQAQVKTETLPSGLVETAVMDKKLLKGFSKHPLGKTDDEILQEVVAKKGEPKGQSVGAKSATEPEVPYLARLLPGGKLVYERAYEGPAREAGQMAAATGVRQVDQALTVMSPVARAINQFDQPIRAPGVARDMHVLSDSGMTWQGAEVGIVGAAEGTVEHRVIHYQALLARGMRVVRDAYASYMFNGKKPTVAQAVEVSVLRFFNRAPRGKMKFSEFSERLIDALNLGDKSDVSEIQAASRKMRGDVMETVNKAAREAEEVQGGRRKLYKEIEQDEDKSYMHHSFSPDKVRADYNGFIETVQAYYIEVMQGYYARQRGKLADRLGETGTYETILRMGQEEAQKIYDEAKEMLRRTLPYTDEEERILAQIESLEWDNNTAYRVYLDDLIEEAEGENGPGDLPATVMKELEAKARELADEEIAENNARIFELEKKVPPRIELDKKEKTQARRRMRYAMQAVGQLEKKRAEALERIAKNEDAAVAGIDRFLKKWEGLKKERGKIAPEVWDEQLAELERQFENTRKNLRISEDRVVKQQTQYLFGDIDRAKLDKTAEKALVAEQRLDRAFDLLKRQRDLTPEMRLAAMAEKEAAAKKYLFNVIRRKAERNAKLRADAEGKFDPALGEQRAKDLRSETEKRIEAFEETVVKAGGRDVSFSRGTMDFSEVAEETAIKIAHAIVGMDTRVAQIDMMTAFDIGERSPMMRRVLNMPYEIKRKWLDLDVEKVLQKYLNTVASDIELFRAFGDRTGGVVLARLEKEMGAIKRVIETREFDEAGKKITDARRRKDMIAHDRAWERRRNEVSGTIERLRHLRGISVTPQGVGQRLGRLFLNMNAATMLGTATISSLGDPARAVMAHGLTAVFRDSLIPFIRGLSDIDQKAFNRKMLEHFRLWGIGNDVLTHQRARNYIDTFGYDVNESAIERFWQKTAHAMPMLALFGPWTDTMKVMTASATMARTVRAIEDLADGKADAEQLLYLTKMNISPQMAYRMADQLRTEYGGTRYRGITLPNTESWTDYQAMRVFQAAMAREDENIVLTPGLERPLTADVSMMGRILFQFHNFTFSAQSKIVASGLQSRNMAAFHYVQGAVFSLALGAVSYYIWAMTHNERSRKEMREATLAQWVDQMIYRSGLLGALSDVQSVAKSIPLTRPYAGFSDSDLAGRNPGDISEGILGASSSKFNDIIQFLAGVDEPTEATARQARKILPWNNVFWLKWAFNEVERGVAESLNLPEKRQ